VPAEAAEEAAGRWRDRLGGDVPVIVTSSATGQGLDALAAELVRGLPGEAGTAPGSTEAGAAPLPEADGGTPAGTPPAGERVPDLDALPAHRVFRPASGRGFDVSRTGPHAFRVDGDRVERLIARFDLDNDEALAHIESRLRRIGVLAALEGAGFEPGDEVEIAGVAFELDPGA